MKEKGLKKYFIFALIITLLLIGLPLMLDNGTHRNKLPMLEFSDDDGYKDTTKADSATLDCVGSFEVENGNQPIDLVLENKKKNECILVVSIYLSDGTKLYKSSKIKSGDEEVVRKLDVSLDKGTYDNVIMCYDCYDENDNPIGRCEFVVKIISV
jgi:hypothetical protein